MNSVGVMFPNFMDSMTGIGVEDLYYGYPLEHQASPAGWTAEREAILGQWVFAGKLVLTIDYYGNPEQIADAVARSFAQKFVPYITDSSSEAYLLAGGWFIVDTRPPAHLNNFGKPGKSSEDYCDHRLSEFECGNRNRWHGICLPVIDVAVEVFGCKVGDNTY